MIKEIPPSKVKNYLLACSIILFTLTIFILPNELQVSYSQDQPNSSSVESNPTSNTTAANNTVTISSGPDEFSPPVLEIEIGSSVKWINSDNQMHSVTSGSGPNDPDLGKYFNSGLQGPTALIRNGTSFEHQFNLGGEFVYFCQLHPNMTGTINVG